MIASDLDAAVAVARAIGHPARLHQPPNPTTDFCAVMTCSSADAGCPLVLGASARVVIPYEDPKDSDGTDREAAVYAQRCRQLAREML